MLADFIQHQTMGGAMDAQRLQPSGNFDARRAQLECRLIELMVYATRAWTIVCRASNAPVELT